MPTKDEYLEDLREFADEIGTTPTKADMNEDGPHSTTPYYNRWGSWNDALEAAGLTPNHREPTRDELLEELRRLADEYGQPVLSDDMDEFGRFDPSTYYRRFDSWFDARDAAGLQAEDVRPGRQADTENLIDTLQALARELGRPPTQSEMNRRGERSITPYLREWGSWESALEAAGLKLED